MSRFKVGDRVRIVLPSNEPRHRQFHGVETAIIDGPKRSGHDGRIRYELRLKVPPGYNSWAREDYLVPIYDGGEPAKWADCVWQPIQSRV